MQGRKDELVGLVATRDASVIIASTMFATIATVGENHATAYILLRF